MTVAPTPGAAHTVTPPMWVIFAVTITGVMGNTVVAPVLPTMVADGFVTEAGAGLVITFATLPGIVLAPVVGGLADRHGRRRVLIACLVAFGAGGVAAGLAPTVVVMLAARTLQGAGSAGLINLAVVLIADHWDGEQRARRIGQNAAVLTATIAVAPPLGGALAGVTTWRVAFAPFVLGFVVAGVVAQRLAHDAGHSTASVRAQLMAAVPVVVRRPVAAALGTGAAVFVLLFGMVLTALPFLLDAEFDLGPGAIGAVLAAPAVTATATALNLGRLRRLQHPDRLVSIGLATFAVVFLAQALGPTVAIVVVAAALGGVAEGLVLPSLQDRVAGAAPEAQRGVVVAIWVGFVRLGQALGPMIVGLALVAGPRAVLMGGAGMAVVTAVAWARLTAGGDAPG